MLYTSFDLVEHVAAGTAADLEALSNTAFKAGYPCSLITPLEDGNLTVELTLGGLQKTVPVLRGVDVPLRAMKIADTTTAAVLVYWSSSGR